MAYYITVDGGTTNTRITLNHDRSIKQTVKLNIGAGSGDTEALKSAVASAIKNILNENSLHETDIVRILASGMITSEYGLCALPHISLPAGPKELHDSIFTTVISDISSIPFSFIRGVKKQSDDLNGSDVMRGEETELMGLLNQTDEGCLYVLPGSHSKHISIDANGRIVDFKTMLSGELFAAVICHTILKHSADFEHNAVIEKQLENGFSYTAEYGINESLFKGRILKNTFGASHNECYSFLMGCILCDEIRSIIRSKEKTVVIGGQKQFRKALCLLLERFSDKNVICLSDNDVESSTSNGAVKIFETI